MKGEQAGEMTPSKQDATDAEIAADTEQLKRDLAGSDAVQGEMVKREQKAVEFAGPSAKVSMTPEQAREMTFDQLAAAFGATDATEAIGTDQFGPILEDKTVLVGVPFVAVHWEFHKGDFGRFVSLWVLTQDNRRYIVNDGSTGIYAQLVELSKFDGEKVHGIDSGLMCKHGLRFSEYDKDMPDGTVIRGARTFYIDTKM